MLRIHLMQNWFGLSDPGMEEALYEIVPLRQFARLPMTGALPDETTILNFRRLLETHDLAARCSRSECAPARTRPDPSEGHDRGCHDHPRAQFDQEPRRQARPEMHQTKKGQQWYFGMKAHIGVDADSGWCTR